jgi:Family of unknown function (DUF5990)/Domain of unknown function (DUF5655)
MSQLPGHPDLDQLRRQARELQRAARAGDPRAVERLGQVSGTVALSAALLAIARDHGLSSWPRLKAEVERRRAQSARPAAEDGYPDYLAAGADELIAGQYADRPHLRPILDAVLAAVPALGPLRVQARKTIVSLVTARRTFAVVQATTKSRVDLGLRLDHERPGGRLLAARDLGAATVRIPLTSPGDVGEEVLGWLRRAYDENAAPPAPRRPARRPAPVLGPLTVVIEGFDLPGLTCQPEPGGQPHRNIHVALGGPRRDGRRGDGEDRPALVMPGRPGLATEPVPGDAASARWEVPVTVRRGEEGYDFSGPFVRGDRTDRHLGLAWGEAPGDGTLRVFRGAKLRLVDIDPRVIEDAMRPSRRLVARIRLTDARGNPVCARVHPPALTWSAEPG